MPVDVAMGYLKAWELERLTPTLLLLHLNQMVGGFYTDKRGKALRLKAEDIVPLLARYLNPPVKATPKRTLTEEEQQAEDLKFMAEMVG